ncbi:hybrid sensor histidine kinase/response regulator [Aquisediminimonas sediminicola]|uniref:hybrid sensor histidine kinase/response regulator n=1 Tax=Alteraquisediminimonas sediminicola TaxID=2676787 RepID=UPI001C8DC661
MSEVGAIHSHPPASASAANGADRIIISLVLLLGLMTAGGILWVLDEVVVAAGFAAAFITAMALIVLLRQVRPRATAVAAAVPDIALVHDLIAVSDFPIALTDRSGRLVAANDGYARVMTGYPVPPALGLSETDQVRLTEAGRKAWRDGRAFVPGLMLSAGYYNARIQRIGAADDHLHWLFVQEQGDNRVEVARQLLQGEHGERLGRAGVMAALVTPEGMLIGANPVFALRAGLTGGLAGSALTVPFANLLEPGEDDYIRFRAEGDAGEPIRLVQVPIGPEEEQLPTLVLALDDAVGVVRAGVSGGAGTSAVNVHALLERLPLGLALADRNGRFIFINPAFARGAGVEGKTLPVFPGDLVIREDKAAVADAVRRFAMGGQHMGSVAVRLASRPNDVIALTIAGARGLGEASVLLSLKDNSEEDRLKNQIAQATKMQAVGQLAGGVAHDFNNILTAIIGHCDLMLMRHTPGDSDYDDIQQIKSNSNRAASLTRQLLAFSRQQTLRPQVLELADVIAEVSNLLRRLLGERISLSVEHDRNVGLVRADPGQLEQVIVNLAVNARDAMPQGGQLTIHTYSPDEAEIRGRGPQLMPPVDYAAFSVADTGTGIDPMILGKIFEPFFTTKEVGKGTGLGLSTVYGIVKQSGGFIFADSVIDKGTRFCVYLPVHRSSGDEAPRPASLIDAPKGEMWGTGTVLVIEDEDMVRAVAERALARHGYTVLTASNGEEAIEIAERDEQIDLIVSDVVMPGMDGPTTVRRIRQQRPEVPVLFMSGYAEEQLRESINIEDVSFLPKPFSVQQLIEAVGRIVATTAEEK